jgi:hypothetical protein
MAYRNEQRFSQALLPVLNKRFKLVQRIESGETGRGIPDIYCRCKETEVWIELKNDYLQSIYGHASLIHWRPGQQAWHLNYYRSSKQSVLTIVAMKDGFLVIPLKRRWTQNMVTADSYYSCTELRDIVPIIDSILEGYKSERKTRNR